MYSVLFGDLLAELTLMGKDLDNLALKYAHDAIILDCIATLRDRLSDICMLSSSICESLKASTITVYTSPRDLMKAIQARREESFGPDVASE